MSKLRARSFSHKRFKDIMHSNYLIDEYDDQFDNESDSHFDDCDEDLYRKNAYNFRIQ
jgi:hypothetical protein